MDKYSGIERAIVSFSKDTDLPWLKRLIKRGYRHCAVHVLINNQWLSLDPLNEQLKIIVHDARASFDMAAYLRRLNLVVVETTPLQLIQDTTFNIGIFTCVEFVKRVVGIRDICIVTPSQLYKKLQSKS